VPPAAAWGRDGRALLVACKDGRLRVIDPDTMEVRREAEAIDGRRTAWRWPPAGTSWSAGMTGSSGGWRTTARSDAGLPV
jgi:hypothetical protein